MFKITQTRLACTSQRGLSRAKSRQRYIFRAQKKGPLYICLAYGKHNTSLSHDTLTRYAAKGKQGSPEWKLSKDSKIKIQFRDNAVGYRVEGCPELWIWRKDIAAFVRNDVFPPIRDYPPPSPGAVMTATVWRRPDDNKTMVGIEYG